MIVVVGKATAVSVRIVDNLWITSIFGAHYPGAKGIVNSRREFPTRKGHMVKYCGDF